MNHSVVKHIGNYAPPRRNMNAAARPMTASGFTLVELLVVMAIIGVLAGIVLGTLSKVRESARAAQCASRMRGIGLAVFLWADDNRGRFPRSTHSASGAKEKDWFRAILPYIASLPDDTPKAIRENILATLCCCPGVPNVQPGKYTYALNVYFEIDPDNGYDGYIGSPQTWRRLTDVPVPARTVLFGEINEGNTDHHMANQWFGNAYDNTGVAYKRHKGKSNYLFVDGHVELLDIAKVFNDPGGDGGGDTGLNRFAPSVAR